MQQPETPQSDSLESQINHDLGNFGNYLRTKNVSTLGLVGTVGAALALHSDLLNIATITASMPVAIGLYVLRNRAIRTMNILKPRNLLQRLTDGPSTSGPLRNIAEDISTAASVSTPIFAVWATEAAVHAMVEPSFGLTVSAVSALCITALGVEVDKTAHADIRTQANLFTNPK